MTPYLSIVMGLGGNLSRDLLNRLTASTFNTCHAAQKSGLDAELVAVEWNVSAEDQGKIAEAMRHTTLPTRIIHAPESLHAQAFNPHGFNYFEWPPKNIGIRRARGEFVLSTNPDDIFSEEMIEYLAKRELQHGHFYRANRHDTRDGEVFRICYPTGGKGPNDSEEEIRRPSSPLACEWHENMIHYSASGDFTLMAKDDWFAIHGNPEREYNNSIDGQTLRLCVLKGMRQVILPYPIYHPDHPRTLNFSQTANGLFAPVWDDHFPHAKENGEGWGFAGMEFEETCL
jgi:hypothetical protein